MATEGLTPEGWARSTLDRSLRIALLLPAISGNLAMTVVLLIEGLPRYAPLVLLLHLINAGFLIRALRVPTVNVLVPILVTYPLIMANWDLAGSSTNALAHSSAWLANLTAAAAAMMLGRRASLLVPALGGALTGVVVALLYPNDPDLALAAGTTPGILALVARPGVRFLRRYAAEADAESVRATEDLAATASSTAAIQESTAAARTLHDTVINTLGAIANGGGGVRDAEQVRERCRQDLTTINTIIREDPNPARPALDVRGWKHAAGGRLVYRGPDEQGLAEWSTRLETTTVVALHGAVFEALQNAAKHADAGSIVLTARETQDALALEVRDDGRGFDPSSAVALGRGVAESILARCEDAGIEVDLRTSIGQGTALTFLCRPAASVEVVRDDTPDRVLSTVQRRIGLVWAGGVTLVGCGIQLTNDLGRLTPLTWWMLALTGMLTVGAWWATRDGRPLAGPSIALMVASVPVALVLSLLGVEFGDSPNIQHWQLLGPTAPITLALFLAPSLRPFVVSVLLYLLAGAAVVTAAARAEVTYLENLPFGLTWALIAQVALLVFRQVIVSIGSTSAAAQEQARLSRIERARQEAASASRARWRAAGLAESARLIEQLANGERLPTDPEIREACAREERHLRQLLLLSPELIHLGYWLNQASAQARDREVSLTLRVGESDAPTPAAADAMGGLISRTIRELPANAEVTVGIFPGAAGLNLTIVHSAEHAIADETLSPDGGALDGWSLRSQVLGQQRLLELAPAR